MVVFGGTSRMFRSAITGLGLITPLGSTPAATWEALLSGRHIKTHALVPDLEPGNEPRVNVLSRLVAQQAIADAGWSTSELREASLVLGTSKGPVERWLTPPPIYMASNAYVSAGESYDFGLAEVATATARSLGLQNGSRLTICAACASGLAALARGAMLVESGQVTRVLVVAVESSIHPLFVSSFQRLGVLPPEGVGCRPMDVHRAGFLLSEAAAAVCLESAGNVAGRPSIAVDRWALAGNATHLTGSDPEGRTIRALLNRVLPDGPVDLIHAHATGTIANDAVELAAIESVMRIHPQSATPLPVVFSHKGALGHSLGASGLISVVLNCLMHEKSLIPPNAQTRSPLATHAVRIARNDGPTQTAIHQSIALAAGFGGAAAAVGLRTLAL